MISRRSLLLATPALILPKASLGSVLNASGRINPYLSRIKPTGLAKINWHDPFTRGLVAVMHDTGYGTYQSLVPGPPFYALTNGNVQRENGLSSAPLTTPTIQTPSGSFVWWKGASYDFTQRGWMIDVDDTAETNIIQKTCFLSGQPAGAALSMFATFISFGDPVNNPGLIFGRSFIPDNENWVIAFTQEIGGTSVKCWCISGAGSGGTYPGLATAASTQIGSTATISLNQLHTLGVSIVNNSRTDSSNSSATGEFFVDGVSLGTTSGLNIPSPGFSQPGQLASTETQLQAGQVYHVAAVGSADNCVSGVVGTCALYNTNVPAGQWRAMDRQPTRFLLPAEPELPEMAAATVSSPAATLGFWPLER